MQHSRIDANTIKKRMLPICLAKCVTYWRRKIACCTASYDVCVVTGDATSDFSTHELSPNHYARTQRFVNSVLKVHLLRRRTPVSVARQLRTDDVIEFIISTTTHLQPLFSSGAVCLRRTSARPIYGTVLWTLNRYVICFRIQFMRSMGKVSAKPPILYDSSRCQTF